MIVDVKVPDLGESISKVEIGEWLVETGERVEADDPLVAIESEKATLEIPAPQAGVLVEIIKQQGEEAKIGEVIGRIDTEDAGAEKDDTEQTASKPKSHEKTEPEEEKKEDKIMPAAARVMAEEDLSADDVTPTGPGGRILKEDAVRAAEKKNKKTAEKSEEKSEERVEEEAEEEAEEKEPPVEARAQKQTVPLRPPAPAEDIEDERRVPMSLLRRTIASRLLEAQKSMAILTTFNEVDMSEVKRSRRVMGAEFADKHEVKLGFMSFFVKAVVMGLADFPLVNARIDGDELVYHAHCHIGVAIGGGKGLVVPVLRHAERLGFAEIERQIADFAKRAKDNSLGPGELHGGTFTISNGGVYGSMLSTPIVNPPQSAILGLHAIKERPVAVDGEVVIRPMMYLALSYDHRIIDGREAVSFLKSIKERIEQPQKLFLEI